MKEFFKRLLSDTPIFFQRLRNFGLSLSATGTALVAIPKIPPTLSEHASVAIWVGAVMAAISQLAVKDPNQLKS